MASKRRIPGWCPFLAFLSILAAGCASTETGTTSQAEEGRSLFADPAGRSARESGAWTIVLAAFRGPDAIQAAGIARDRVALEGGLRETAIEQRGEAVLLTHGRFSGPEDPRSQDALARVRSIEINGINPFTQAMLTPPEPPPGRNPQYDLRRVREMYGPTYAYTLQIGVYGRTDNRPMTERDREDARDAAERAVATLRSEGELAFYHHGPNFSTVTVGLFRDDEVNPTTGLRSAAIMELQSKFPYNLLNGAQRTVRIGTAAPQAQRSVLVGIPTR